MPVSLAAIFVDLSSGDALVKKIVEKILFLKTGPPFFVKYFSQCPIKFSPFKICNNSKYRIFSFEIKF